MADIKLTATKREEFGKGAARRLRRDKMIPAVLYGQGADPLHIALPYHETMLALRQANVLLELEIEGERSQLALPKQVQREPVKNLIEHLDLIIVKRGQKVTVDVPVVTTGEHGEETVMMIDTTAVSVEALATSIPEQIEVDITDRVAPDQILAGQLALPEGVTLLTDPEVLIVNFTLPISEEALAAELEVPENEDAEAEETEEAAEADETAEGEESAEGGSDGDEGKADDADDKSDKKSEE